MGNICGAAPSKELNDQPIDHKTANMKVSNSHLIESPYYFYRKMEVLQNNKASH